MCHWPPWAAVSLSLYHTAVICQWKMSFHLSYTPSPLTASSGIVQIFSCHGLVGGSHWPTDACWGRRNCGGLIFCDLTCTPLIFLPCELPSLMGETGVMYLMEKGEQKCKESRRAAVCPAGFCLFSLYTQLLETF